MYSDIFGAYATHTDSIEKAITILVREYHMGYDIEEPGHLESVIRRCDLTPSMVSTSDLNYINQEVNRRI